MHEANSSIQFLPHTIVSILLVMMGRVDFSSFGFLGGFEHW